MRIVSLLLRASQAFERLVEVYLHSNSLALSVTRKDVLEPLEDYTEWVRSLNGDATTAMQEIATDAKAIVTLKASPTYLSELQWLSGANWVDNAHTLAVWAKKIDALSKLGPLTLPIHQPWEPKRDVNESTAQSGKECPSRGGPVVETRQGHEVKPEVKRAKGSRRNCITPEERAEYKKYRDDYLSAAGSLGFLMEEWLRSKGLSKKDHQRRMNATKSSRLKSSAEMRQ
jgi:hypothetical protein